MDRETALKAKLCKVMLGAAALFSSACSMDTVTSNKVQPAAIYQNYSLSYSEDTNVTYLDTTFRVGGPTGTTVLLVSPSRLLINGQEAQPSEFFGTHYETRLAGYQPSLAVAWYDQSGKAYPNTFTLQPIHFARSPNPNVYLNTGYSVPVIIPDFSAQDQVSASINETDPDSHASLYASTVNYDPQTQSLIFSVQDLQQLKAGSAVLQLGRSRSIALQNVTDQGGDAVAAYWSTSVRINLTNPNVQVSQKP